MARFLFTTWPIPGHVYPQIAIAQALRERGHESAFFTGDRVAQIVEREGFGPERSHRAEVAQVARALAGFPVPKDILVYSLDEFEWRRSGRNNVVARAVREGRLLYDRP